MADIIPFPNRAERERRCQARAHRARLEAEYAGEVAAPSDRERNYDDIDWLILSDFEPRPAGGSEDGPYDPLLEALIELMETDADGPYPG